MWLDTCELISKKTYANESGKLIEGETNVEEVFCEVKSIGMREFYSAQTNNLKPEIQITVKVFDYNYETYIIYNNVNYTVVRTFKVVNSDTIELYLARGIHDVSS